MLLSALRALLLGFACLTVLPLALHAVVYSLTNPWPASWRSADWSSTGLMPSASERPGAFVGVYTARAGRWRGIFAVHSWIVIKREGAPRYTRYDVVGWGRPVRRDAYPPDGRWYGNAPKATVEIEGARAARLIDAVEAAVADYPHDARGDYRIWPGPNSNSFVAHVLNAVPGIGVSLPPEAMGRNHRTDGRRAGLTRDGRGVFFDLGGLFGASIGSHGLEINVLGAVTGVDFARPALILPGFGRIGRAEPASSGAAG